MRVHLTGGVYIEAGDRLVEGKRLPGRLGRLAFAYLAAAHDRPVSREELAGVLWPGAPPATWEKGTTVLMSKLRAVLAEVGPDGRGMLTNAYGCYQLSLPAGTWLDVAAAADAADAAEVALAGDDASGAAGHASVAASLARRDFLPGEYGEWVNAKRDDLRRVLVRALDCLGEAHLRLGSARLGVQAAAELTALEPFRESGYVLLMRAHAAAGDRAEALRVHEECRRLLSEELGVDPSPATEAVYLEILRSSIPPAAPATASPVAASPVTQTAGGGGGAADAPGDDGPPPTVGTLASSDRRLHRPGVRAVALAAAVLAAGAVAAGIAAIGRGGSTTSTVVPGIDTVARIAPAGDGFAAAIKVGERPTGVTVAEGDVWVINYGSQTLSRVDRTTGSVLSTRAVGGTPTGIAFGAGAIWVTAQFGLTNGTAGTLLRFDATSGEPSKPIPLGDGVAGISFGAGAVWVANQVDDTVIRIDPLTSSVTATIHVGRQPRAIAVEGTSVWVANALDGTVSRIDAGTNAVVATLGTAHPNALAADAAGVWVVSTTQGSVTRIDPATDGIVATLSIGAAPTGVGIGAGGVWVAVGGDGVVVRVDPSSNRVVARLPVHGHPDAIDSREGAVWVTVHAP